MDNFLFSEGSMQTTINNKTIDKKSYKFEYTKNKGKGFIKNNNDTYFIELDDDDIRKIFKKEKNPDNIEKTLSKLLNNSKKSKTKSTRKASKKSKTKSTRRASKKSKSKTKSTRRTSKKWESNSSNDRSKSFSNAFN